MLLVGGLDKFGRKRGTKLNDSITDDDREEGSSQGQGWLPKQGRRTPATWFLLAINLLVWLAMEYKGGSEDPQVLLDFGAMFGPFIAGGEYWRLFTAMFLHVGPMHMFLNGLGLLIFGKLAEPTFGLYRFVIIYVLAGLAGSVASYGFNDAAIGAGASGAIMGILGALAAFYFVRRDTFGAASRLNFRGLLVLAGLNLIFGFMVEGVDNWAHMGGMAGGFLLGLALAPDYQRLPQGFIEGSFRLIDANPLARRWWVVPVALAVLLAGTAAATARASDETQAYGHVMQAERFLDDEEYTKALDEVEIALGLDKLSRQAHYVRGKIMAEQGFTTQAIIDLSTSLRLGLDGKSRTDAVATLVRLRGGGR